MQTTDIRRIRWEKAESELRRRLEKEEEGGGAVDSSPLLGDDYYWGDDQPKEAEKFTDETRCVTESSKLSQFLVFCDCSCPQVH